MVSGECHKYWDYVKVVQYMYIHDPYQYPAPDNWASDTIFVDSGSDTVKSVLRDHLPSKTTYSLPRHTLENKAQILYGCVLKFMVPYTHTHTRTETYNNTLLVPVSVPRGVFETKINILQVSQV